MNLLKLDLELNRGEKVNKKYDINFNGVNDYADGKMIHYIYGKTPMEIIIFTNDNYDTIKSIGFKIYGNDDIAVFNSKKEIKSDDEKAIYDIFNAIMKGIEKVKKKKFKKEEKYTFNESFFMPIQYLYYLLLALIYGIAFGSYFYTKYKIKKAENLATKAFNEENEKLFGKNGTDPGDNAFSDYLNLIKSIETIIFTPKPGALVLGDPGLGKTFVIRRTLFKNNVTDYVVFKGSTVTLETFYLTLFKNSNKIIILDDFDEPLKNLQYINTLKAITDSYGSRVVTLPTDMTTMTLNSSTSTTIPNRFMFTGKVIIVTNLKLNEIDSALRSRLIVVDVKFNIKQTLEIANKMLNNLAPDVPLEEKQEVMSYLSKKVLLDKKISLDLRKIQDAFNTRHNNPDIWKKLTDYSLQSS